MTDDRRKIKNRNQRTLVEWFRSNMPNGTLLSHGTERDIVVRNGVVLRNWTPEKGSIDKYKGD